MSPFRYRIFMALWIASIVSFLGSFVHSMAATWLMTEITSSRLFVALIQTASFLPFFLFTFPAGILADHVNRRKLLLLVQSTMLVTVIVMVILVWTHTINVPLLLTITFIINTCSGLNAPAWQLVMSDMLPQELLPSAVTLNSLGYNIARAIGPALGGIIIGAFGLVSPFIFDAISYTGVIATLFFWSGAPLSHHHQPTQKIHLSALFAGFQYVWKNRTLRLNCYEAMAFFLGGSSIWSLLALIAKHTIKTNATGYGILFGFMGIGAILAATILLRFRKKLGHQQIIRASILAYAVACFGLITIHHLFTACIFSMTAGFSWLAINTSFNIFIQTNAPAHLKARIYAVYLMTSTGMLTLGSYLFGIIAEYANTEIALLIAGVFLIVLWLVALYYKSHLQAENS